ncbi:MAG: hypothetical protein ACI4MB_00375, partial [Candidatus Coproplasma sp.]
MVFKIILLCLLAVLLIIVIISSFKKRSFVKLFDSGNVIVSGLRGRGKDLAFCLVVNARKKDYISNVQYSSPKKRYKCFPLDLKVWELSGNNYNDMITGEVKTYVYPYPDGIDYYISDAGIYFPSQYQAELCKKYKSAPMFQALSRHLGDCNVHCNVQNMPRLWDKIREQSDIYIRMDKCKFFGKTKFCYVRAYVYSNQESCINSVVPPRFGVGKVAREAKYNFEISHGKIIKY